MKTMDFYSLFPWLLIMQYPLLTLARAKHTKHDNLIKQGRRSILGQSFIMHNRFNPQWPPAWKPTQLASNLIPHFYTFKIKPFTQFLCVVQRTYRRTTTTQDPFRAELIYHRGEKRPAKGAPPKSPMFKLCANPNKDHVINHVDDMHVGSNPGKMQFDMHKDG